MTDPKTLLDQVPFDIDPVRRTKLRNGWDDIDLTQSYRDRIASFRAEVARDRPWIFPAAE